MGTSMPKRGVRRRIFQLFAVLLVPAQVLVGIPLQAAEAVPAVEDPNATTPPPEPPKVTVNREVPPVDPVPAYALFSSQPSNEEITEARVFAEPLAAVDGIEDADSNKALAKAIRDYQSGGDTENVTPFDRYLSAFPKSPWRGSLLANLGVVYRRKGYYTRAEAALNEAWTLLKDTAGDPLIEGAASRALSELLQLHMDFGQQEPLEDLLGQVQGRELNGGVSSRVLEAQSMVWSLKNAHHTAIPSGTVALRKIAAVKEGKETRKPELDKFHATHDGASIVQMRDLARQIGLKLRIAKRESLDAPIPYPAMAHLVGAHFTALVREEDGKVKLDDPLLGGGDGGGEVWMSRKALAEESSGYFLIEDGTLPKGWRAASDKEARVIRGKCKIAQPDWGETGEGAVECGGDCDNCEDTPEEDEEDPEDDPNPEYDEGNEPPPPMGMARYSLQMLVANLRIRDTPIGYRPPRGPAVRFRIFYSHMEAYQPQTFTFANTGSRWSSGWVSYLEDDPDNPNQPVQLMRRGGGRHTYSGIVGGISARHKYTRAQLVRTSVSPVRYERRLSNGAVEVFEQADGALTMPRRIFMTQSIDPQGNRLRFNYDSQLRLASVVDAINQVTTLSYGHGTDKRKITKVTDPFGRSARLDYSGAKLVGLTDTIGVRSSFEYSSTDFVRGLRTPYGRTTFSKGGGPQSTDHWIESRDAAGGRQRAHYQLATAGLPSAYPAASVPRGFAAENALLAGRNSFYWGKRASAAGHASDHAGIGGNFDAATRFHWLWDAYLKISGRPALIARGGGSGGSGRKVWHAHAGEVMAGAVGSSGRPAKIGMVLADGRSRVRRYEHNALGKVTRYVNSVGAETAMIYAANGINRLSTKRKTRTGWVTLSSATYNAQHLPLTITNAANKATSYVYNAYGQVLTARTPDGRTTTYTYSPLGYPQAVTGPSISATTRYSYDGFGRVRTVTGADNYIITLDYNAMDQVTRVTFPDGTYVEGVYEDLRLAKVRNRAGGWTTYSRNDEGKVTSVRNPQGRIVQMQWCDCRGLEKLIDANGRASTWDRDDAGRVTRFVGPNGSAIRYTYEPDSDRLATITDEKSQVKTYSYTTDGKLAAVAYTNEVVPTTDLALTYDPVFGHLMTATGAPGTTTFTYHPAGGPGAGRLASEDGPYANDLINYVYDDLERMARMTVDGVTTSYGYDTQGRQSSMAYPGLGDFVYEYAGDTGRRASLTYPNGSVTSYNYDATVDNLLGEIHHRAPGGATLAKFGYTYDAHRNIKTWRQENESSPAAQYDFSYDSSNQLISAVLKTTDQIPAVLKRYRFGYDAAGNRTHVQMDDVARGSTYDNMNRLMGSQGGGALTFKGSTSEPAHVTVQATPAQTKDTNEFEGRAEVGSGTSVVTITATDPSGNARSTNYQVDAPVAPASFTYDANGNLASKTEGGDTWTYEWDAENRLARALKNGVEQARFVYDFVGRRTEKVAAGGTTTLVYAGEDVVKETTGSIAYRYVHGPGVDEPHARIDNAGMVTYYFADHLGSIRKLTNAAGTTTLTRSYDPWGNLDVSSAAVSGPAFTGREWDAEIGLYHYRARYYDPGSGRFLSEDPVGAISVTSLYAYVDGNPVARIDPNGEDWLYWTAQFTAGFGDTVSFGLTNYIRDQWGINDVVDKCSGAYAAGVYAELGIELALTGGSFALKGLARGMTQKAARLGQPFRGARPLKRTHTMLAGAVHHITPLKSGLFPTAGLPRWIRHSRINLQYLTLAEHRAAHAALARHEAYLATAFNPVAWLGRLGYSDSCGCE